MGSTPASTRRPGFRPDCLVDYDTYKREDIALKHAGRVLSFAAGIPAKQPKAAQQALTILTSVVRGPDECPSCGKVGCFCDRWAA